MDLTLIPHSAEISIGLALIILLLLVMLLVREKKNNRLQQQHIELQLRLELEQQNREQLDDLMMLTQSRLANTFNQLSSEALSRNNTQFLKLAEENLKRFQSEAKADLSSREKAIEQLVRPINETLQQTSRQIQQIEKERKESYGSLKNTLELMNKGQQQLQAETQNLVQALRRPEVRGQWGEMTLHRLAELSGMVEHCDFFEQTHTTTETGAIRPDMIVRLPESREIIVDAKTPLDAYLSAIQARDDRQRQQEMQRHAQVIRNRVRELSRKNYWVEYSNSPEFVVLFIPGEQFLASALEVDPGLLEDSMSQNIILATPTNFIALLRAVSYGWKQLALAENAEKIRELGENLYNRLATFSTHLDRLGKSLSSSVDAYNKSVGSLEKNVLPSGRKFVEMGIRAKKELEELQIIEKQSREVTDHDDQ